MRLLTVLLAVALCACSSPDETTADCSNQVRFDGTVYTGYAFTDREATEVGVADKTECHDVGEDAEGSAFGDDPEQVDVSSFEGYSADEVVGVRFDDQRYEVYFAESLSSRDIERISEELSGPGADRGDPCT